MPPFLTSEQFYHRFLTKVTADERIGGLGYNLALLFVPRERRQLSGAAGVGPLNYAEVPSQWAFVPNDVTDYFASPPPSSTLSERVASVRVPIDGHPQVHAVVIEKHPEICREEDPFVRLINSREIQFEPPYLLVPVTGNQGTEALLTVTNMYSGQPLDRKIEELTTLARKSGQVLQLMREHHLGSAGYYLG
ncbi:hypothetical protein J4453_02210 [Candidatus Woesearchaeota archaeon]|nr:hypothetical protein [Candidatus Woesearchaeota archaeon]